MKEEETKKRKYEKAEKKKQITSEFATRLMDLIYDSKESISYLADKTGVASGALSKYQNSINEPSISNLVLIANHFNVSTDYLLGLTNVKTRDIDIQAICKKTGLSEKSIALITILNSVDSLNPLLEKDSAKSLKAVLELEPVKILNAMLESDDFFRLIYGIERLNLKYKALRDVPLSDDEIEEDNESVFSFALYNLHEDIKNLIISVVKLLYEENKREEIFLSDDKNKKEGS